MSILLDDSRSFSSRILNTCADDPATAMRNGAPCSRCWPAGSPTRVLIHNVGSDLVRNNVVPQRGQVALEGDVRSLFTELRKRRRYINIGNAQRFKSLSDLRAGSP